MVLVTDGNKGIFVLDKVLRDFGVWQGPPLDMMSDVQRAQNLAAADFSKPVLLTLSDYDPNGYQLVSMTSHTMYDEGRGILDDRLVFWRHLPWEENAAGQAPGNQYILHLRFVRDRSAQYDDTALPDMIPEQLWWNGAQLFQGMSFGGHQDPFRPEHRRLIARAIELSQRVKERLRNQGRVSELGRDFQAADLQMNMAGAAMGSAPVLRALNDNGFDPVESYAAKYFSDASHRPVRLQFREIKSLTAQDLSLDGEDENAAGTDPYGMSTLDMLDAANGYYFNSLDPSRQMVGIGEKAATSLESGIKYVLRTRRDIDQETGEIVYRIYAGAEDVPHDQNAAPAFELASVRYRDDGNGKYTVQSAKCMEFNITDRNEMTAVIGVVQRANHDIARGVYPDLYSVLSANGLERVVQQMGVPPGEKDGGEFKVMWLHGRGMNREIGPVGGGEVGGGTLFMSRVAKDDGRWSETYVLHDFPLIKLAHDSNYEGAHPDIMPLMQGIRNGGALAISHKHFDHNSIQNLAAMIDEYGDGWLKGLRVICRADVGYVIKKNLARLNVPKKNWPSFIEYEKSDGSYDQPLQKTGDKEYLFTARDEDGVARIQVQICADGSVHTARTDLHCITGCYGDDIFHQSILSAGDSVGITDHGKEFYRQPQRKLAQILGVDPSLLPEKYIALEETTSADDDDFAPSEDHFKQSARMVLESMPENLALAHHCFSTNDIERKVMREVVNEPATLRHTTAIGANMEIEDANANIHGADPFIDLRDVVLAYDKIPARLYALLIPSIEMVLEKRRSDAAKTSERLDTKGHSKTVDDLLAEDEVYSDLKDILEAGRREIKDADIPGKSRSFYDAFFANDDIAPDEKYANIKRLVLNELNHHKREMGDALKEDGKYPDSNVAYVVLRDILKKVEYQDEHGETQSKFKGSFRFESRGAWNDKALYEALMREDEEQEFISLRRTRTSEIAKRFRNDLGRLLLFTTGAIGNAEEQFATFAKLVRGESLLDHDPVSRPTGYKMGEQDLVHFCSQTPSMGPDAGLSQQKQIAEFTRNRNKIWMQAIKNGLEIYNPGQHLTHFMAYWSQQKGITARWDAANNKITVHGRYFHFKGHNSRRDFIRKFEQDWYDPAAVELYHVGSKRNYQIVSDLVVDAGLPAPDPDPENFVAYEFTKDDAGLIKREKTDFLTPAWWMFNIRRKWGLQYGGRLEMDRYVGIRRGAGRRSDALDVRSRAVGHFFEHTASKSVIDSIQPKFGPSPRQYVIGPSIADIQTAGHMPRGMTKTALARKQTLMQKRRLKRDTQQGGRNNSADIPQSPNANGGPS